MCSLARTTAQFRKVQRDKVEFLLLRPPASVTKLIKQYGYTHGSIEYQDLLSDAMDWAIDALYYSHFSSKVKATCRQLLASSDFGPNLGWACLFNSFKQALESRLNEIGGVLTQLYHEQNFQSVVGTYHPPLMYPPSQRRQDCKQGIPTPKWDFSQWGAEAAYIHVLRMIAIAIDSPFVKDIGVALKSAGISSNITHNGIKSYSRMRNKMVAAEDHRFKKAPRPAQNVDINRVMVTVDTGEQLRGVLECLYERFGGYVKFKNGMASGDAMFGLRLCLVSILYRHPSLNTIGSLVNDRGVQAKWKQYIQEPPAPNIPKHRWRNDIAKAHQWLLSPEIAQLSVGIVCEVQCLIRSFRDVRMRMHELYKAYRAVDGNSLQRDFRRSIQGQDNNCTMAKDTNSPIKEATTNKQLETLEILLEAVSYSKEEIAEAMCLACKYGSIRCLKRLLEVNTSDNPTVENKQLQGLVCV